MGDDVAALEQRKEGAQRRVVLADVDHHRQIERAAACARRSASRSFGPATLSDMRALTPMTTSRLRAMAPRAKIHIGAVEVVQFAAGARRRCARC